jgi:hypothetical protein
LRDSWSKIRVGICLNWFWGNGKTLVTNSIFADYEFKQIFDENFSQESCKEFLDRLIISLAKLYSKIVSEICLNRPERFL